MQCIVVFRTLRVSELGMLKSQYQPNRPECIVFTKTSIRVIESVWHAVCDMLV